MDCGKCNKSIRNKNYIRCDGMCKVIFHATVECADITDYDLGLLQKKNNLLFMCDECILTMRAVANKIECVIKTLEENREQMKKQENDMKMMLDCIKNLNVNENKIVSEIKKACIKDKNVETTYASKVKNSAPVIVKPKNKQSQKKTKDDLSKNVSPAGFEINEVQGSQNGVVAIRCANENDSVRMQKLIAQNMGDNYEVKMLSLRKPRVYICDIGDEYDAETIVKKLKEQNEFIKNSEIKCLTVFERKIGIRKFYNAILETESECFNKMLDAKFVSIGWNKCRVFEDVRVNRCYKCLGFNHKSTVCTQERVCAKCLGNHKKEEACKTSSELNKCINCIRANKKLSLNLNDDHNTFSKECPVYARKMEIEKKKVSY